MDDRIKELEGKTRLATEYYQDSYGRQRARYVRNPHVQGMRRQSFRNLYGKRKSLNGQIRKDEVKCLFRKPDGCE
ncbi:hypothetical protein NXW11_24805 [Bacteroides thetaiotaomicron]|nr:hypothetical protein [Bacteroides thetaiotaomicron]